MKKLIILLVILCSVKLSFGQSTISQMKMVKSKEDILSNDTLLFLTKKLDINLDDYTILSLSSVCDSTTKYEKEDYFYEVTNTRILFDNFDCQFIQQQKSLNNFGSEKNLSKKLLYCDYSISPTSSGKKEILIYTVE